MTMKAYMLILAFALIAGLASASDTISLGWGQNVVVTNAIANGTIVQAQNPPQHQTVNVLDGGGQLFINNVSINSPPPLAPPPANEVVNVINGGGIIRLLANNVTIDSPPANTYHLSIIGSNVPQNGIVQVLPGVFVDWNETPDSSNQVVYLTYNEVYQDPFGGPNVIAPNAMVCSLSGNYIPSWNSSISIANDVAPCAVNYTIDQIPFDTNSIFLGVNGSADIHGLHVYAPTYAEMFSYNTLNPSYSSFVNNATCSNIDTLAAPFPGFKPETVCLQPKNESEPSIYAWCQSYKLQYNLTYNGLYECMQTMYNTWYNTTGQAEKNAQAWENLSGFNARNATYWYQQAQNFQQLESGIIWLWVGTIIFFIIVIGSLSVLIIRARDAPPTVLQKPPEKAEGGGE